MSSFAYYNGDFGEYSDISIPLSDRSIFFGDAIYDAALAINGKIVWESEHVDRFLRNIEKLSFPYCFKRNELVELLREAVKKSNIQTAFLYFQLSRNNDLRVHSAKKIKTSNLLITVESFTFPTYTKPLSLITVPDERYGYCNIKTTNLLPSVIAATEADKKGCDEAVFLRSGIVTECSKSNIFIVKDGTVMTHPKSKHILPGIAREKIIIACKKLGMPCEERTFTVNELLGADEILISSTTKLCLPATKVDNIPISRENAKYQQIIYDELHKEIIKIADI